MKQLLIGILFLGSIQSNAQTCTRTGNLVQTDVSIVGTVNLIQTGTSITIELESDFLSDSGPDLDVYLSNEPNPVATGIRIDALTSLSGTQSYDVPSGININDYQYVVVHCTQYNHLFGSAQLGSASGNCQGTTNTSEQKQLTDISVIQHKNKIQLNTESKLSNPMIKVFDLNGKVISESKNIRTEINLEDAGVYFINVSSNEGIFKKKIIIQ